MYSLGILLSSALKLDGQVSVVTRSEFVQCYDLAKVIYVLLTSHMDCCNIICMELLLKIHINFS